MNAEKYISISHWGMFKLVTQPEREEVRKRIEKLLFPIVEQIVNVRV